jgi:hypothetical protein
MWVQMMESISGGRPGGGAWPPRGYLLECEDWEGNELVAKQLAVQHPAPPAPAQMEAIEETAPSVAEVVAAPQPPDDDSPVPTPSDPKSVWVAYAVSQGASEAEAENLTKVQLQAAFGGRLLS